MIPRGWRVGDPIRAIDPCPYDEDRELDDCGGEEPREELPWDGPCPGDGNYLDDWRE